MSPQQFSTSGTDVDVDAVLGVALTSSAVGMVLVEGSSAEGATLDHDSFATDPEGWASALGIAQQASDAVMRTCAISAAHGYHVRSIGLTWNDDADAAATALLNSLAGATTRSVAAVALRHAGEALLTWRTRSGIDSGPSAFCVLRGDTATVVRVDDKKQLWHESIDTSSVIGRLHRRDRRPEVLFAVGPTEDAAALTSQAESVLGARVSAPTEALLALARGAALVAARGGKNLSDSPHLPPPSRTRRWALAAAVTAVAAGAAWSIFAVGLWRSTPSEVVPVGGSLQTGSSSVESPVESLVPTTIAVVSAQPSPRPVIPAPDAPSVTLTRVTRVAVPASIAPSTAHYFPPAVEHLPPNSGVAPINPGPGN
jgi:hypothetical protein